MSNKTISYGNRLKFTLITLFIALNFAGPPESQADSDSPPPLEKHKTLVIDIESLKPEFGLQLFGAPSLITNSQTGQFFTNQGYPGTNASTPTISAFGLMVDYQPWFLQFAGAFDFGATLALNPILSSSEAIVNSILSIYTLGLQARYQLRLFSWQPLIPVVGYFADNLFYSFQNPSGSGQAVTGRALVHGPMFGVWLLLNWIEPSSARQFYINSGASRSYLTFEVRQMTTLDGKSLNVNGRSYLFGIRMEF